MQKISYKETITLPEKIEELLLINIDEKLSQIKKSDDIHVSGHINISGEVSCNNNKQTFLHPLEVDILLSKEQLINDVATIMVDDFNYNLVDNKIEIDLIIRIDGLKEIEAYFPAQENKEDIQIEEYIESQDNAFDKEMEIFYEEPKEERTDIKDDYKDINIANTQQDSDPEEVSNNKPSLLNQIFKHKSFKKDSSFLFHVVKQETNYKEIASLYSCNEDLLKSINNNEEIYIGKLILIPKS